MDIGHTGKQVACVGVQKRVFYASVILLFLDIIFLGCTANRPFLWSSMGMVMAYMLQAPWYLCVWLMYTSMLVAVITHGSLLSEGLAYLIVWVVGEFLVRRTLAASWVRALVGAFLMGILMLHVNLLSHAILTDSLQYLRFIANIIIAFVIIKYMS